MIKKLHGLLLVNKPVGPTSHDVVHQVRKILKQKDIGHAGTLDPLASGLMVLLLGEATKLSELVLNGDKGYDVTVELGVTTDTLDREGQVLTQVEHVNTTREQLEAAIRELTGPLELAVPNFSAVKIQGKKLYDYARKGEAIEAPKRVMDFREVTLVEFDGKMVHVKMVCSKGSYVRSWAQALGEKLGCGGCVSVLNRWFSAPYQNSAAVGLDELKAMAVENPAFLGDLRARGAFVDLSNSLPAWPSIQASGPESRLIENGVISRSLQGRLVGTVRHSSGGKILSTDGRKLLALIETDEYSNVRIRRVFRYDVDAAPGEGLQPS